MADIFISYSKRDADAVRLLAAALEAQGWSVWWDTSLEAGDAFRRVIMTEIAKARAVIVVWTETSVTSDWVMAEAGRGHADGKLIPVRARGLDYKAIPLPFGNLHTEYVDAHERIAAAVTSQLAKPVVTPSAAWLATKELRYQVLTWVSIVGGALTLFSSFSALIQLSEVARLIVDQWQTWMQAFWRTLFGWIGFKLPKPYAPVLTGCAFLLGIAISERVKQQITTGESSGSFLPGRWWWPHVGGGVAFYTYITSYYFLDKGVLGVAFVFTGLSLPFALTLCASRDRLATAFVLILALACIWILIYLPLKSLPSTDWVEGPADAIPFNESPLMAMVYTVSILSWALPAYLLTIAPARLAFLRLVFLTVGVVILLGLNEFAVRGVSFGQRR